MRRIVLPGLRIREAVHKAVDLVLARHQGPSEVNARVRLRPWVDSVIQSPALALALAFAHALVPPDDATVVSVVAIQLLAVPNEQSQMLHGRSFPRFFVALRSGLRPSRLSVVPMIKYKTLTAIAKSIPC